MALRIDVVTLFPGFFKGPLDESILRRAQREGKVDVQCHDLRDYTHDKHRTVDDTPYGGGAGMLMKPEPLFECVEALRSEKPKKGKRLTRGHVVYLGPHGKPFDQQKAKSLARRKRLILIAGHYEGIDQRVREHLIDEEISIGDFITMGGEAPALCVIEAVTRLVPGVLGNQSSIENESFQNGLLEYPQYTKPREYRGWQVPEVLFSGHHQKIDAWRKKEALRITRQLRNDLLKKKK